MLDKMGFVNSCGRVFDYCLFLNKESKINKKVKGVAALAFISLAALAIYAYYQRSAANLGSGGNRSVRVQ